MMSFIQIPFKKSFDYGSLSPMHNPRVSLQSTPKKIFKQNTPQTIRQFSPIKNIQPIRQFSPIKNSKKIKQYSPTKNTVFQKNLETESYQNNINDLMKNKLTEYELKLNGYKLDLDEKEIKIRSLKLENKKLNRVIEEQSRELKKIQDIHKRNGILENENKKINNLLEHKEEQMNEKYKQVLRDNKRLNNLLS